MQKDRRVMSVAKALALANETALATGWDPATSLVTITEELDSAGSLWRVHYGPRDYINRRGGDLVILVDELVILVDEDAGSVRQVLRGQ
jgi:hypothetical protein